MFNKHLRLFVIIAFYVLFDVSSVFGQVSLNIHWLQPSIDIDGSPLSDLAGYKIHMGRSSGVIDTSWNVGNVTSYTLRGMEYGCTYYLTIGAYNSQGEEGPLSEERIVSFPYSYPFASGTEPSDSETPIPDEPPDSETPIPDEPPDSETPIPDELSDSETPIPDEPSDSGVPILDEPSDSGTPVLDELSGLAIPGLDVNEDDSMVSRSSTMCAEWNGFLDMYNVFEHINRGSLSHHIQMVLYNINGKSSGKYEFDIDPGKQVDVLAHDLPGWSKNSYGIVCSEYDGAIGGMDGRMVYYRPRGSWSAEDFEFAYSVPVSIGKKDRQYVGFNTFQPSLASEDSGNFVANWLQLTNLSDEIQIGTIVVFDADGFILDEFEVVVKDRARKDFALHAYGHSKVGLVQWRPQNTSALFMFRNVRYLYDNVGNRNSFETAYFMEGAYGSGALKAVPLNAQNSSVVLEISNVTDTMVNSSVNVFSSTGDVLRHFVFVLAPHATHHIIVDELLRGEQGVATIEGDIPNSLLASVMHYGRKVNGGVEFMYGIPFTELQEDVVFGSYNTFLGQDTQLVVLSVGGETQHAERFVSRAKLQIDAMEDDVLVASNGCMMRTLSGDSDCYGMVTLIPNKGQGIVAWLLRVLPTADRRGVADVIPIPLR